MVVFVWYLLQKSFNFVGVLLWLCSCYPEVSVCTLASAIPQKWWFDVSDLAQPRADAVDLLGRRAGAAQQACFFEPFLPSEIK